MSQADQESLNKKMNKKARKRAKSLRKKLSQAESEIEDWKKDKKKIAELCGEIEKLKKENKECRGVIRDLTEKVRKFEDRDLGNFFKGLDFKVQATNGNCKGYDLKAKVVVLNEEIKSKNQQIEELHQANSMLNLKILTREVYFS